MARIPRMGPEKGGQRPQTLLLTTGNCFLTADFADFRRFPTENGNGRLSANRQLTYMSPFPCHLSPAIRILSSDTDARGLPRGSA